MKLLLKLSYLGTHYCGYQVQKNAVSVQEKLQDAIEDVYGKRYNVTGCSRTDAGVHARMYFCTVDAGDDCEKIPCEAVPAVLGKSLPVDISVLEASLKDDSFHPRYDVKEKEYEYLILNSKVRDPFLENRAYRYPMPLDVSLMQEAARRIIGRKDFCSFMSSGSSLTDTVRNVTDCSVFKDGDLVRVRITADGFLYNMVRIIVGTLIDVSAGKIMPEEIDSIILGKDRSKAGFTAPACGLYLIRVEY